MAKPKANSRLHFPWITTKAWLNFALAAKRLWIFFLLPNGHNPLEKLSRVLQKPEFRGLLLNHNCLKGFSGWLHTYEKVYRSFTSLKLTWQLWHSSKISNEIFPMSTLSSPSVRPFCKTWAVRTTTSAILRISANGQLRFSPTADRILRSREPINSSSFLCCWSASTFCEMTKRKKKNYLSTMI